MNILSAEQEEVCRKLASKEPDKFKGISHVVSAAGNPIIDGSVGWIECEQYSITDAGDHKMVTGRVVDLNIATGDLPLLFFRGGYGRFSPASLVADQAQGITLDQLRHVDCARALMEDLARRTGGACIATVRVSNELVIAASAGEGRKGTATTLVGQRLPFSPPTGAVFAAWLRGEERDRWADRASRDRTLSDTLKWVAERGFSVGLRTPAQKLLSDRLLAVAEGRQQRLDIEDLLEDLAYDPAELTPECCRDIRLISAPVFNSGGEVELALTLYDFRKPESSIEIKNVIDHVVNAAKAVTLRLNGEVQTSNPFSSSS